MSSASAFAPDCIISFGTPKCGPESKLLDGSFNNNRTRTSFGGKAMFGGGNDAININMHRPVQPASKLLDNWFNGNSTHVNVGGPRAKADVRLIMPM
jgi:hypothetical protein